MSITRASFSAVATPLAASARIDIPAQPVIKFAEMSKLQQIENDVQNLSPEELVEFRKWFADYDAALWNQQLERDANSGRLDKLRDEALAEHQTKRTCATKSNGGPVTNQETLLHKLQRIGAVGMISGGTTDLSNFPKPTDK